MTKNALSTDAFALLGGNKTKRTVGVRMRNKLWNYFSAKEKNRQNGHTGLRRNSLWHWFGFCWIDFIQMNERTSETDQLNLCFDLKHESCHDEILSEMICVNSCLIDENLIRLHTLHSFYDMSWWIDEKIYSSMWSNNATKIHFDRIELLNEK